MVMERTLTKARNIALCKDAWYMIVTGFNGLNKWESQRDAFKDLSDRYGIGADYIKKIFTAYLKEHDNNEKFERDLINKVLTTYE